MSGTFDTPNNDRNAEIDSTALFNRLQELLRRKGEARDDIRLNGLYLLLHTPRYGPVEVTDHFTAANHSTIAPDTASDYALIRLLSDGHAILSLTFGADHATARPDDPWFVMAYRKDIRPQSIAGTILDKADIKTNPIKDLKPIAFNMAGVLRKLGTNPYFRDLKEGIDRLG